ncbi:Zinc finger SWIM domain-containing protein 7 [Chamberlinius hualienensis]
MKIVDNLIEQLLKEVHNSMLKEKKIPEELMKSLWAVFQKPLMEALNIVDRRAITRVSSPDGRTVFQITSNLGGISYTCYPTTNYCSCLAFRFSVLKYDEYPMCKHVLAARLADAMDLCDERICTDEQISQILISID